MRGKGRTPCAPEEAEMLVLAQWLDAVGLLWCHPPNEGMHSPQYLRKRAQLGVKRGVPDVIIFDRPPNDPEAHGVAIELKRVHGAVATASQREWIAALADRRWRCAICKGADAAIAFLISLGWNRLGQ